MFLLFALSIFLVVLYIINIFVKNIYRIDEVNSTVNVSVFGKSNYNCTDSKIPCVSDSQCLDYCLVTSIGNKQTCLSGYCSTSTIDSRDDVECNGNHGLFKTYISTSELITSTCISLYRDIYDDYDELRPTICSNGTFDIDLTQQNINVDNCVCDDNYTLMSYTSSIYTNISLICVHDDVVPLYNKIYTSI
nr:per-os infectivity factor 3 [Neodiprion sertifer nucleopolyhedrovirus]